MAIKIELGQTKDEKRFYEIIESLSKRGGKSEAFSKALSELKKIADGDKEPSIKPFSLFVDTWEVISNSRTDASNCTLLFENAKKIYDDVCVLGDKTPDFELKSQLYLELINEDGALLTGGYLGNSFNYNLFASFADKTNFKILIRAIKKTDRPDKVLDAISDYGLRVREFIIDDYGYLANLLSVVKKLGATVSDNYGAILDAEISTIERSNGVY
ncbi:MAG: hypothetical protein J5626_01380, partial [Lachnospiraceae bacterium]|nr:hypothetical protein [Lachnospiraceae bacterium]